MPGLSAHLSRVPWCISAMLVLSAVSSWAQGFPAIPPACSESPEFRARLDAAATNSTLEPWQREFMRGLVGAGAARGTMDAAPSGNGAVDPSGEWDQLPPPSARVAHSAIYDPVRDRMIVFGGSDDSGYRNDVWALNLSGTPAWSALSPTGTLPTARQGHTAIYDPVRDRMVVFGGSDGRLGTFSLNEVWALSLSGTPGWSALSPSGTLPNGRYSHTAIYDPMRDRMVVFGGADDSGSINNVCWALSLSGTPAWSALSPTGTLPSAHYGHTALYDPTRDRMVVFGGYDGSGFRNDVWALGLSGTPAWSALSPTGTLPAGRDGHTAIYDPVRDRVVVFGGFDGGPEPVIFGLNDVWALSLSGTPGWGALSPTATMPTRRDGHTAIYDPVRDCMIVFGGSEYSARRNDVWALSLSGTPAWSALSPTGTLPSGRYSHTAIYDPVRDRMVVFAGGNFSGLDDVWALSLSGAPEWIALSPTGPPPSARSGHTAIYDPVRDRMVAFGGYDGSDYRNDVWALSLSGTPAWSALGPTGTLPSARVAHSAIYDLVSDRMVGFGGYGGTIFNDVWRLTFSSLVAVDPEVPPVPSRFEFAPPRPNPAHHSVSFDLFVPHASRVSLTVYDSAGRIVHRVADALFAPGRHTLVWNRRNENDRAVPNGIYFVRLHAPGVLLTRKGILIQ